MDKAESDQTLAPKLLLWRTESEHLDKNYQTKKPEHLVISPPKKLFCAKSIPSSSVSPYPPTEPVNIMTPLIPPKSTESIMNQSFRHIVRLSRVTAWMIPKAIVGISSSPAKPKEQEQQDPFSSAGEELVAQSDAHSQSFNKSLDTYKRNLRFNVHQITSLTSARDLEYELLVRVNEETVAVRYGQLKKLAKGISSCSLPEDWLSLKVDGPFKLSMILNTKPTRPSKVADYLARRGLWPLWFRKRQPDPASTAHLSCWSSSSESSCSTMVLSSSSTITTPSGMTPTGYLDLSSGNDIENGQHHYRLLSSTKKSSHMELLVEFLWQPQLASDRVVTPSTSSSNDKNTTSFVYPWLRYPLSCPDVIEKDDHLLADKDAIHTAMSHVTRGDYLTFYLYELASPKWERYWVTLKNKRLQIISTMHKNKDPIYDIALDSLEQVSKPTEEDQEHVCLNRQVGIVLQLKADDDNSTPLGNRIYILADTPVLALHWIRALTVIKSNNLMQKSNSLG
ncbi:hypothetical protein BC941DRAFT_504203 [Chlamydoabsidia padenii]|nr:hypothetical protein BC941DRAFT_504203 [Chlamydoabsidia padenii]